MDSQRLEDTADSLSSAVAEMESGVLRLKRSLAAYMQFCRNMAELRDNPGREPSGAPLVHMTVPFGETAIECVVDIRELRSAAYRPIIIAMADVCGREAVAAIRELNGAITRFSPVCDSLSHQLDAAFKQEFPAAPQETQPCPTSTAPILHTPPLQPK